MTMSTHQWGSTALARAAEPAPATNGIHARHQVVLRLELSSLYADESTRRVRGMSLMAPHHSPLIDDCGSVLEPEVIVEPDFRQTCAAIDPGFLHA